MTTQRLTAAKAWGKKQNFIETNEGEEKKNTPNPWKEKRKKKLKGEMCETSGDGIQDVKLLLRG